MADYFVVVAGPEFERVERALSVQAKTLADKLDKELEDTANKTVVKVQAAALAIAAYGHEHTGVRIRLARGVKLVRSVEDFRIITSMDEPDEVALPRGFDTPITGWLHPVFGNQKNIVRQIPEDSWFRETVRDDQPTFERNQVEVIEDARDDIADAGDMFR